MTPFQIVMTVFIVILTLCAILCTLGLLGFVAAMWQASQPEDPMQQAFNRATERDVQFSLPPDEGKDEKEYK